jgi:1A family penicillin-binding protein
MVKKLQHYLKHIKAKIKNLDKKELSRKAGHIATWAVVVGSIAFFIYFIYLERTLPDPETLVSRQINESTKIYDHTGEVLLYDIHGDERRTVVAWDKIADNIKKATIASEDNSFYEHRGLDYKGIIRSLVKDIRDRDFTQGGSTITQQLIKNTFFTQEKLISRKIRELILAIKIERKYNKDQILWMYLNQIPYGSNLYGVEAASQEFFGKHASELTLAESAVMAAVIKAPSYYSPHGSHLSELTARRNSILSRMKDLGYISEQDYELAQAEELKVKPKVAKLVAPHFVIMARDYLIKKYGQDIVETGGFKITTTLDADLQTKAEELVEKYSKINKERYKANNAALVAVNPKDGGVLALVGSSDYFDVENEGNFNVATALRQPGSSFKPFAYAAAFQKGYPDYTVLFDVKTEFNTNCSPDATQLRDRYGSACYHPQNYDGAFRGPVTLRQSLDQSLNIPSVKTLYLAGIDNTIDLAIKMGITTLEDRSRFGLSLVLGGAEVRPIDLASAYGVFANEGVRNPWGLIQKIELADGTVLEERQPDPERALDTQTARLMNDVLSDNSARAAVFGNNSPLYIPGRDVAAKTGTTQQNRDAWVVGYTPSIATVVWAGNNDNKPMTAAGAGISASGPLWNAFMRAALEKTPVENFTKPNPIQADKVMLNGTYTVEGDGSIHSILYYVDRNDPLGPTPSNPESDEQFKNWEWAVTSRFSIPTPSPEPIL